MRRDAGQTGRAYALLAPSLIGVLIFMLLPIGIVIWLSFQHWDLIAPVRFVGLTNWQSVLGDPELWNSLKVTALLVVMVVPVQTMIGLVLAVMLNKRLPGSAMLRVVYSIPWVCAPLALGLVWKWIFAPTDGALNALLGTRVAWLSEPTLALPSVAVMSVWSQVGYVMLFFLAGLAGIPDELIEAAQLDGASRTRIFWSITMPMLRPTTFFVVVTSTITAFQMFDNIYALTQGGPRNATDVISYRIYSLAFTSFDLGRAAVSAMVLFAIIAAVTLIQQRYFARRITYDVYE